MDIHLYLQIQLTVKSYIANFDLAVAQVCLAYPSERPETLRSIVSQEYVKFIKANYRRSHFGENRTRIYRQFIQDVEGGAEPGIIIRLAEAELTSPALLSKLILEEYLKEATGVEDSTPNTDKKNSDKQLKLRVTQLLRNHSLIEDRDLAYEIFLAKVKDHGYGPIAESIKQSIGEEYEQLAKDQLVSLGIPFSDEHVLRSRGYDKTPDIKLEVPIAVNGKIINWIESKALFGDRESHEGYLKDQFWSYWNRFGPGLVIYWFGYIKQLDNNQEAGIVLADHLPTDILFFQPDKALTSKPTSTSLGDRSTNTLGDQPNTTLGDRSFGELTGSSSSAVAAQQIKVKRVSLSKSFSDLTV